MMEEMLRNGDFAGLAALCEQEELEVRPPATSSAIQLEPGCIYYD